MNLKTYTNVTIVVFIGIALAHLVRAFFGWHVSVAGWVIPIWLSWVGFVVASLIVYSGYALGKQR